MKTAEVRAAPEPYPFLPPAPHGPRRTRWTRTVAMTVVALTVLAAAGSLTQLLVDQHRDLDALSRRVAKVDRRTMATRTDLTNLASRLGTVQDAMPPGLVDLVARAQRSLFVVRAGRSQGTAFVIEANESRSLLITNFHVVASAWTSGRRAVVLVRGDQRQGGRILRVDTSKDLAVIAVDRPIPALAAGTHPPSVGDRVIVIGEPFGLEGTVADGIVSGTRRGFLQFSAPISPGDSGAPVLDEQGRVVGVAAQKIVANGAEGLSFAVPIAVVCRTVLEC